MIQSEDAPAIEPVRMYTGHNVVIQSAETPAIEPVSNYTGHGIITADWDAPSTWKVAYPSGVTKEFTPAQMLAGEPFTAGVKTLVVESAHLKERNAFSVSQVYETAELDAWNPAVEVKLFPARLAPKVGAEAGNTKADDAVSLFHYIHTHPKTLRCLKDFQPPSADPSRATWVWRDEIRADITQMLNIMRARWKGMSDLEMEALPQVTDCRARVTSFYAALDPSVAKQFKIKLGKVGARKGEVVFESPTQIFTAYACVFNMQGELRVNPRGTFIGIDTVMNKVVGLNHSHMPNLARANLMHFGLRPKLGKRDAPKPPAEKAAIKAEFTRNFRTMLQAFRDTAVIQSAVAPAIEPVRENTGHAVLPAAKFGGGQ